jgi:hypothetical protein
MDHPRSQPTARIAREARTVAAMIDIYCHALHGTNDTLCNDCSALRDYALCRLDRCPHGTAKTPCAICPTHCFQSLMRARIKVVMRYAGPRMLFRHPVLAVLHQWDNIRGRRRLSEKGSTKHKKSLRQPPPSPLAAEPTRKKQEDQKGSE